MEAINCAFRPYRDADLEILTQIMLQAFEGVSIDQGIEQIAGPIHGHDWRWRKARHLLEDINRDREGILVVEMDGQVVGFVSSWMDHEAGIGYIPNISLTPSARGHGLGRQLLWRAMERFRQHGLTHAKIETLAQNQIGNHLYRAVGFQEVARQVHFIADLRRSPEISQRDSDASNGSDGTN